MAQEKDERVASAPAGRKTGESGDDKRTAAPARAAAVEAGNGASKTPTSDQRPERYIIGSRTTVSAPTLAQPHRSMDEVVTYLDRQDHVEVLKRIKLGGTQPFSVNDRSAGEIVVASIDEGKAQRLRAGAPPDLIIERDSMLSCADYVPVFARASLNGGTLLPLRSVATEVTVRIVGERDQPLSRATVVIDGGGLPAQALTDDTGTARITFFGGSQDEIQMLFIRAHAN